MQPELRCWTQTDALRERSRAFAVRVLRFVKALPRDPATEAVARQLARSGPGLSSNYHSACRARSRAEFISRMAVAVDEADESWHWLVVLRTSELASGVDLEWLVQESCELRAIFARSVTTARENQRRSREQGIGGVRNRGT